MELILAQKLAHELLEQHNLLEWGFGFYPARRQFGRCNYTRKMIYLSTYLTQLNPESEVRSTILHEISHALVGSGHGHDKHWKQVAISIGDSGERCFDGTVETPKGRFVATCPNCSKEYNQHRRPVKGRRLYCTECYKLHGAIPHVILQYIDTKTGKLADLAERNPRFASTCGTCGSRKVTFRRPTRPKACGACCNKYSKGKFDEKFVLIWTDRKTGRKGQTIPNAA